MFECSLHFFFFVLADSRAKERLTELGFLSGPCHPGCGEVCFSPLKPLLDLLKPLLDQLDRLPLLPEAPALLVSQTCKSLETSEASA